ncbi:MAG: DEAD/DEAH box helicase family protein, partial [bacterium]
MQHYHDARETPDVPDGAVSLTFENGTLLVEGISKGDPLAYAVWDERVSRWRSQAIHYRSILAQLLRAGHPVWDAARDYVVTPLHERTGRVAYAHQAEALEAWRAAKRSGVVVLPTGSGKSFLAVKAIEDSQRSALVVAPTLDLVEQWLRLLRQHFETPVGAIGGGTFDPQQLTVTTYDSAAIHMERLGNRFGLVIFDEVHHLPSPTYRWAAEATIAPFRLGLTATLERPDGLHALLETLIGPTVYARNTKDLAGDYLSDYRTEVIEVPMTETDAELYATARAVYRDFVTSKGIRMGGRRGWHNFLVAAARSEEGRQAFRAFRRSKQLAMAHERKIERVAEILHEHRDARTLVFTN